LKLRIGSRRHGKPDPAQGMLDLFAPAGDPPAPPAPPPAPEPPAPAEAAPPAGGLTPMQRADANVAAIETWKGLAGRPATGAERAALAGFTGWGATPGVFDPEATGWAKTTHARLSWLLTGKELRAARRTVLTAHYTDPAVAAAMWAAARALGFTGAGEALEPGCGTGTFIRGAGPGQMVTGVEADPVTAGIAAALHPGHVVKASSFGTMPWRRDWFDLVIGNVPFGKYKMPGADPVCPDADWSIHNHFLIKSLRLLRPGGVMLALTSRYTLDGEGDGERLVMGGLADLIGAVRLPENSHRAAAGTNAAMDVLVFRRREPGRAGVTGLPFTHAVRMDLGGESLTVSQVFGQAGGGHVLGELTAGTSPFGPAPTVKAPPGQDLGQALTVALAEITARAVAAGLAFTPRTGPRGEGPDTTQPGDPEETPDEGNITERLGGRFAQWDSGRYLPLHVPDTQRAELSALLRLKATVRSLLAAEAATTSDTAKTVSLRAELNTRYDAYTTRWGCLNRYTATPRPAVTPAITDASDAITGVPAPRPLVTIRRPRQGGFRHDPGCHVVYALEKFDGLTQTAEKAGIFSGRVIARAAPVTTADTPADALAVSLDVRGRADPGFIAGLLGLDEAGARAALAGLAYPDPQQGGDLVPAAEYLSGNVRAKLAAALAAARDNDAYQAGADALRRVQPAELGPAQIKARLGAAWIPADDVAGFLRDLLDDPGLRVEHPGGAVWGVSPGQHKTVLACSTWGTDWVPAYDIAKDLLEQRPVKVYDTIQVDRDTTKRILNPDATAAALEKAAELADAFTEWLWSDADRTERLCRTYNDHFNNLVLRSYDGDPCTCDGPDSACETCKGTGRVPLRLTLPGLAKDFRARIHPHQSAGVARAVAEPAALLAHVVGAGKTATMVMSVMELRRLGLIGTAAVVVPNHMLEQFGREWIQLYPQARVLVTGNDDLTREGRRRLHARVATGRWDAVIMSRTVFERIPMSAKAQEAYWGLEVDRLTSLVSKAGGLTVKRVESARARLEWRVAKKLDALKDPSLTWEMLGITYLVVDELHGYKNLLTVSAIPDANIDGAKRSTDLHMKVEWLRARYPRVILGATATPIANSLTEAFVMAKYMRPDVLADAGVSDFDVWAATFGTVVTKVELAPEGGTAFRLKSRFAEFGNVTELKRMFHLFADVKRARDLRLDVPLIARRPDGRREAETVVVSRSQVLAGVVSVLGERAKDIRNKAPWMLPSAQVNPLTGEPVLKEDNMLWISTTGRQASLSPRLLGIEDSEPGKTAAIAAKVAGLYHQHPGKLQIVFLDMGTPGHPDRWNAYDDTALILEAAGVPRHLVRFIHDAKTDRAKAALFADCRAGRVSVIIGSTEKMGTGVNIQDLAVAVHHGDAPWKPAEIEQRDGRAIRQGNTCPEVHIIRYVTEQSFDAFMWQTLARKAFFIDQFMDPLSEVRELSDPGDMTMSYTQVQAVATGNPLLLDAAEAREAARALTRQGRQHDRTQDHLGSLVRRYEKNITAAQARIIHLDGLLARREDTTGDNFLMYVDGLPYESRADAGKRLQAAVADRAAALTGRMEGAWAARDAEPEAIGRVAGFEVTAGLEGRRRKDPETSEVTYSAIVTLRVTGVPDSGRWWHAEDLAGESPSGLVQKLEHAVSRLEAMIGTEQADIAHMTAEIGHARQELGKPFAKQAEMEAAQARAARLDAQMAAMARASDTARHAEAIAAAGKAADPEEAAA
jgi:N12 class adenine-specific DNA methylase/SAM-dependent methyltransferase